jgi:hypothetical protein
VKLNASADRLDPAKLVFAGRVAVVAHFAATGFA